MLSLRECKVLPARELGRKNPLPDIPASPTSMYLVGAGATIWITQQVIALVTKVYNKKNGTATKTPCGCPMADQHTEALTRLVKGVESMGRVVSQLPSTFERQRDASGILKVMCSNLEKQTNALDKVAQQQAVLMDRHMRP